MKDNQFTKTKYRVQFKYTNSPTRQQLTIDPHNPSFPSPKSDHPIIISQQLHKKCIQNYSSMHRIDRNLYQTSPTMKKQVLDIEALTLRKQIKRKSCKQTGQQGQNLQSEVQSDQSTGRSQETFILKQEIRYIRQKLNQAQSSQKSIRLQFQLYKASAQPLLMSKRGKAQQKTEQQQQQRLLSRAASLQKQNQQLHLLLFQENKKSMRLEQMLEIKHQEYIGAMNKFSELSNQAENKVKEIEYLHQELSTICQNNQLFYEENLRLKHSLEEKQQQISQSQQQLFKMKQKNMHFEEKVFILEGEIQKMANKLNQLRIQYQRNIHKFSGNQSAIKQYEEKIKDVQSFKMKLEQDHRGSQLIFIQQNRSIKQENLLLKNENIALKTNNQILISNQRIMLNEIEWLKSQLNLQASHFDSELDKLHKKEAQVKNEANQHYERMLKQKQAHILQLQEQIATLNKEGTHLTSIYEQNINNIISLHERQLQYFKNVRKSQKFIVSSTEAKSLSQQQLHQHIHQLKSQHQSISSEQYILLQQQNSQLKQQLQNLHIGNQQNLQTLRQRYQKQIAINNQQYTEQLAIYMKEVQILMDEMDKIRSRKQICGEIIQESAEEDECDNYQQICNGSTVKKDLIMFGDDLSQVIKTDNNTPIKAFEDDESQNPLGTTDHRYMLQEIIDLDSKINNYIVNYNKRKSQEDPLSDRQ